MRARDLVTLIAEIHRHRLGVQRMGEVAVVKLLTLPHGSVSTYTNHRCRCIGCTAAWAAYCRAATERRAAAAKEGGFIPHGTSGGYTNYLCRCARCRRAVREADRRKKAAQRASA